jgi:hypothetical protein
VSFLVRLTREAEEDLMRLYDFVLERELGRADGGDLDLTEKARNAMKDGFPPCIHHRSHAAKQAKARFSGSWSSLLVAQAMWRFLKSLTARWWSSRRFAISWKTTATEVWNESYAQPATPW